MFFSWSLLLGSLKTLLIRFLISGNSRCFRVNTLHLDITGPINVLPGSSVVAPIIVAIPSSMIFKRDSC